MQPEVNGSEFDLDKKLGIDFVPANIRMPLEQITEPRAVFLTGATGFLGAFLLGELLQQTSAEVYCLVRAAAEAEARERLRRSLVAYQLWDERFNGRICPVVGDLALPYFGLSAEAFQSLAEKIDLIYHNGALVNFTIPYANLRAPNVFGTLEVLKLACQAKVKPVHFVSTLGVFSAAVYSGRGLIREDIQPERGETLLIGYTQSKWMAERLVSLARDQGLPVCIHRPGRVVGHSQTGACQTNDFFWKIIKACISIGKISRLGDELELLPVDYLCQAIVYFSRQPALWGKNFHYFNPHPLPINQVVRWLNDYGYWLEQVPFEEWRSTLIDIAVASPDSNEAAIAPLFWNNPVGSSEGDIQFDCQNTLAALAGTSIVCPPVSPALLETYFSYFVRLGFLNAPAL